MIGRLLRSSYIPTISKSDVEGRSERIWYYGLEVGAYLGKGAH